MSTRHIVISCLLPGTDTVECGRCGWKVDSRDKEAKRRHDRNHKAIDRLTKKTGIDPLRHDECVATEAKAKDCLSSDDNHLKVTGVFELEEAAYSRYVLKAVEDGDPHIKYFDDYLKEKDLEGIYRDHPGLAQAVRSLAAQGVFPYAPTRAACERFLGSRRRARRRCRSQCI